MYISMYEYHTYIIYTCHIYVFSCEVQAVLTLFFSSLFCPFFAFSSFSRTHADLRCDDQGPSRVIGGPGDVDLRGSRGCRSGVGERDPEPQPDARLGLHHVCDSGAGQGGDEMEKEKERERRQRQRRLKNFICPSSISIAAHKSTWYLCLSMLGCLRSSPHVL